MHSPTQRLVRISPWLFCSQEHLGAEVPADESHEFAILVDIGVGRGECGAGLGVIALVVAAILFVVADEELCC